MRALLLGVVWPPRGRCISVAYHGMRSGQKHTCKLSQLAVDIPMAVSDNPIHGCANIIAKGIMKDNASVSSRLHILRVY